MNNLDPDVAERPEDLIVYGGTGQAARNWEAFDAIVRSLRITGKRRNSADPIGQTRRQFSARMTMRRGCCSRTQTW